MSSSDEEVEYEVESILCARVEKKRGRKKGLVWKYKVRWKGYKPEDDTWEPEESFPESSDLLGRFWERANTDGRDYKDIKLFEHGEEFLPVGPPRRKRKMTQLKQSKGKAEEPPSREDSESPPPQKRRRTDRPSNGKGRTETPASKGKESQASPSKETDKSPSVPSPIRSPRKPTRKPSIDEEIIPPSDEEIDQVAEIASPPETLHEPTEDKLGLSNEDPIILDMNEDDSTAPVSVDRRASSPISDPAPSVPFHQHRAANPLVRLVQDPHATEMENAIAVKVRLGGMKSPSNSPRKKGSNGVTNKNKSSVLTFDKGELKSVKGKYRKPEEKQTPPSPGQGDGLDYGCLFGDGLQTEEIESALKPEAPPTAEELLKLAGADPHAEIDELEEFEDDVAPAPPLADSTGATNGTAAPVTEARKNTFQHDLELFPARNEPTASTGTTAWKTPTIFGPLSFGFKARSTVETRTLNELNQPPAFTLSLNSTTTIPIVLNQLSPTTSHTWMNFSHEKGPPGKFYPTQSSGQLLDSLRKGNFSAQATLDLNATAIQQAYFNQFVIRLRDGDIFVAVLGQDVLAFCSAENSLAIQRLNIHPSLSSSSSGLLVSHVIIENYTSYAEAALTADDWHSS